MSEVKTLVIPEQGQKQELEEILEKAVDFHGHLGPFLVLGIRMGFIGLRELGVERGNPKLRVTVMTKPSVPFSCVVDGIQAATTCTVGNRRLKLQNSQKDIVAKFQILEGNKITVAVNLAKQEELKKRLSKQASSQEIEIIARGVISMPERELFKVKKLTSL
jgi:formylmethanofuran dehydrogenase subunit E